MHILQCSPKKIQMDLEIIFHKAKHIMNHRVQTFLIYTKNME